MSIGKFTGSSSIKDPVDSSIKANVATDGEGTNRLAVDSLSKITEPIQVKGSSADIAEVTTDNELKVTLGSISSVEFLTIRTLLEDILLELRRSRLHLNSMSDLENVNDLEVNDDTN